jgi:hypothetical protein
MTIGQIVECISGKACAHYGSFGDCTPFVNLRQNMVGFFGELLTKLGFHSSGNEIMYDGMTGTQIESEVFMGPTYYMRLKHMVKDKINYRARGPLTNLTRQPVSGRANDGGLRIGEMERDGVISHGAAYFLKESMMERADAYQIAVCNKTGMLAIYNPNKNVLFSPMADGPVKYTGSITDTLSEGQLHPISKFGRDFSIVAIPYSFKLFMQELFAMNIRMSLITEDNISQIENMGFSTTIDPKAIIEETRKKIENIPKSPDFPPPPSLPKYEPRTPDYTPPPSLPKYEPRTPDYTPPLSIESKSESESESESSLNSLESPDLPPPNFLQGGEIVHYRGDIKPHRSWKVDHVGPNFCTISTDDDYQLNTEDTIKVVKPDQLYLPNDNFVYSIPYEQADINTNTNSIPMSIPIAMQDIPNPNPNPTINFSPVIKIINDGNDMSSGPSQQPSQQPLQISSLSLPENTEKIIEPIVNEIDFSIPIIKK